MRNFTCAQVFLTNFGWIRVNPLNFEKDNHLSFKEIFKDVGVTTDMIMYGDK